MDSFSRNNAAISVLCDLAVTLLSFSEQESTTFGQKGQNSRNLHFPLLMENKDGSKSPNKMDEAGMTPGKHILTQYF